MKWISLLCFTLLLCLAPLGCALLNEDEALPLPIQTENTRFEVTRLENSRGDTLIEFNIGFSYTNPTKEDRYLIGCNRPPLPDLEKQVNDQWVLAYTPGEDSCLSPPWRLVSGASLHDSLYVLFISISDFKPVFRAEISGVYRLVGAIHRDAEGEELVELSERVSNSFRLEERGFRTTGRGS